MVLALPRGKLTLKERVFIKRSNLVLRGAGLGQTVLYIPKSEHVSALSGVDGVRRLAAQVFCPGAAEGSPAQRSAFCSTSAVGRHAGMVGSRGADAAHRAALIVQV